MPRLTEPPDPHPRKPKLALPPGACDCHMHLFGPAARYPISPDSRYDSPDALAETYLALQETLGVSRAVFVSAGAYARDYRLVADTLRRFPGRFRGIVLMPDEAGADDYEALTRLGVCGLRFVSAGHGIGAPTLSPGAAARAKHHGWHVQFFPHGDIADYADQLLALDNTVVLDHFAGIQTAGRIAQDELRAVLRMLDTGRVWVKLSAPMRVTDDGYPYTAVTAVAHALVRHAPERLVWGSDWPHVNLGGQAMPNDGDLADLLANWVPDGAIRKRILVDNACALYGFPPV